jgi:uncharacterized membrane protein
MISFVNSLVLIGSFIFFISSSLRHLLFKSTSLDLTLFDQWVYLISQGLHPISSITGFHVLGDHAAFILYPISLLYRLYSTEYWLFIVQAIALAVGCIPVYKLSRQADLSKTYSSAIAFSYLLYPVLFNANFYTDYRPEAIAVPSLVWAVWAVRANKTIHLFGALILALTCKDSLTLLVVSFGVWLLLLGKRLYGIGAIALGSVWYVATIGYLVPLLRQGQAGGVVFYGSIGSSPKEILITLITNPQLVLSKFLALDNLFYYLLLIVPVIVAVNWRQIVVLIPALPMLLLNTLSDYSAQRDLIHHYALPIVPFLFVWLIDSIAQSQKQGQRKWLRPRVIVISAVISFLLLAKPDYFISRYLPNLPHVGALRTAVSLVTTKESVLTTSNIAPHLSHREIIKVFNPEWKFTEGMQNFKYILLDLKNNFNEINPDVLPSLKSNSDYKLSYENDQVYLFVKG